MSRKVCNGIVNEIIWFQNFVKLSNYNIKLRTFFFLFIVSFLIAKNLGDELPSSDELRICPFAGALSP
jgi:hypothetical protein